MAEIKRSYYKLVADEFFEDIYPRILYNQLTRRYTFEIVVSPKKHLRADIGGNISTRSIGNVYLGLQYNYLNKQAHTIGTNFYFGRFYESGRGYWRIDYATRLPLFLELDYTYNGWNYFYTSQISVEKTDPIYIRQDDQLLALKIGIPFNHNMRLVFQNAYIRNRNNYSLNNTYSVGDVLDKTTFNGFRSTFSFEKSNLNRKQYANKGRQSGIYFNLFSGTEQFRPGNILRDKPDFMPPTQNNYEARRTWVSAKISDENYFLKFNKYTFGYLVEAVVSNQPFFYTYYSTLLNTPAFYPLQDSRSLFLSKLRAHNYVAGGLKSIYSLKKNIDIRLEGYIFAPFREFQLDGYQSVKYADVLSNLNYAASLGIVYHTPFGPVGLSYNKYNDAIKKNGVLLHLGFLIYNKKSIE